MTWPLGPTISAARQLTSPAPEPNSITAIPGSIPAISRMVRVARGEESPLATEAFKLGRVVVELVADLRFRRHVITFEFVEP
jgi:hypothetical protein